MSTYRIEIDQSLCSGFGACAEMAPDVFALEGGIATIRVGETDDPGVLDADGIASIRVGTSDDAAVVEAADTCPMGAILVTEVRAA